MPSDMNILIQRATTFLYYVTHFAITLAAATADYPLCVKEATCEQLDYWLWEVGYGHYRLDPQGDMTLGSLSMRAPKRLAPAARDTLRMNGYLNRRVYAKGMHFLNDQYVEDTEVS